MAYLLLFYISYTVIINEINVFHFGVIQDYGTYLKQPDYLIICLLYTSDAADER
nr:hypothetical protein [Pedobacter sp. ASV19]